jgi:hypothetical protein
VKRIAHNRISDGEVLHPCPYGFDHSGVFVAKHMRKGYWSFTELLPFQDVEVSATDACTSNPNNQLICRLDNR